MELFDSSSLFMRALPLLMHGAWMTVKIVFGSFFLSFSLGLLCGILSYRPFRIPFLSQFIEGFAFLMRAIPFFVQLLLVYFVLPDLVHCDLEPLTASILALGACSCGYVAQIIRSALQATQLTQWEGAFVLGFSRWRALYHVILPQMLRQILPQLNNEIDSLLKSSAVASSIGLLELTRMGMNLVSREMQPLPIYLLVAFFYVVLSILFCALARFLERRWKPCYTEIT
jgi:His/Glu/Gln/Arg/opine family amino acid ABC transporter permease subunit